MNVIDAMRLAKEQGRWVRVVGDDSGYVAAYQGNEFVTLDLAEAHPADLPDGSVFVEASDILADWEVVPRSRARRSVKDGGMRRDE